MGVSLSVRAYKGVNTPEYNKHFNAVKFCIKNALSYPVETSEFFKGTIDGDDLEDYTQNEHLLSKLCNGVNIEIPVHQINECEIHIFINDIPAGVDKIVAILD